MASHDFGCGEELERWLEPLLARLGNKTRRRMCPRYIAGLIGPGDRKSVQPMAARFAAGEYDRLHHFIAAGLRERAPLEAELLAQADRLVGGDDAVLAIDDTALPKKGRHSVGGTAIRVSPWQECELPDIGLRNAGRGRPHQRHTPDSRSIAAETMLAKASWRSLSWRRGTNYRSALHGLTRSMRLRAAADRDA